MKREEEKKKIRGEEEKERKREQKVALIEKRNIKMDENFNTV